MADIFDLSKLDELDIATLEKQLRDIILSCLYENWHDEASMIGDDLVTRIADDALLGIKTPIQSGQGGFNFDLSPYIDPIIHGAGLLVFLWHIYMMLGHMPPPHDTQGDPEHRPELDSTDEEDLVGILANELKKARGVEPVKATKFARLLLHVINNGR